MATRYDITEDLKHSFAGLTTDEKIIIEILDEIRLYVCIDREAKKTTEHLEYIRHGKREAAYRTALGKKIDGIRELTSRMDCKDHIEELLTEIERSVDFEIRKPTNEQPGRYIRKKMTKKDLEDRIAQILDKHNIPHKSLDLKAFIDAIKINPQ